MSLVFQKPTPRRHWLDSKSINRALFGVYYEDDIYERACAALPTLMRAFGSRMDKAFKANNLIFIHVPRAAGMSIARAMGAAGTRHYSARYFKTINPAFFAATPSFAVLRDPVDRFLSAYAFVRDGGAEGVRLSDVFVEQTAGVRSVDDYLTFLEGRGVYDLDFVMRPQSWFVCDLATGKPLVKDLFLYGEDNAALAAYLTAHNVGAMPWLNRSRRQPLELTAQQRRRIEAIYADDFALIESLRAARATRDDARIARIAAE